MNHLVVALRGLIFLTSVAVAMLALTATSTHEAIGQDAKDKGKEASGKEVPLETKDGVYLKASYFAGTRDKDSVPVILLHEYNGNRRDLEPLAVHLNSTLGCAVIVPDLRGHGDSTLQKKPMGAGTQKLILAQFNNMHFLQMTTDLEAVKKFLMAENNAGKLNIDKLSIVGVQMGATIGLLWSAYDWSYPTLSTGKQGKDVKVMVMVSPAASVKSLSIERAFAVPSFPEFRDTGCFYFAVGADDNTAKSDAERIYNRFTLGKKQPEELMDIHYLLDRRPTKLQGTKLLTEPAMKLEQTIGEFIKLKASDLPNPWQNRPNPLG